MDYGFSIYLSQKQWFKIKIWWICLFKTCSFSLHKMLIDWLGSCGLLMNYCDIFIGRFISHSDGTHSLQDPLVSNWCNAEFQNCSDEETNSFTFSMAWVLMSTFSADFQLWVNYSFKIFFSGMMHYVEDGHSLALENCLKSHFVAFYSLYSEKTLFQNTYVMVKWIWMQWI